MDNTLPSEFDLIVVGTGFTESVVAAAASRIGKTVLHVDVNEFYGGPWASFSLEAIQDLAAASPSSPTDEQATTVSIDDRRSMRSGAFRLENAQQCWSASAALPIPSSDPKPTDTVAKETDEADQQPIGEVPAEAIEPQPQPTAQEVALKLSRRFNIDLTPKLLYARGQLVELLISSNICRYSEFRAVDRVCTMMAGSLRSVPCSRSDIFTSKEVSVVEKRLLSKHLLVFLNLAADDPLHTRYAGRTFREYLVESRLPVKLVHYVLHAIAMCGDGAPFAEGAERTKRFLLSAERYGSTPFLFAMYGCGELPQCFCRLCAVFGGIYCLKRSIDAVHCNSNTGRFEAITCDNQRISAANIIFGPGTVQAQKNDETPSSTKAVTCGNMSRGILLTNRPFGDEALNSGGGGVILLKLQADNAAVEPHIVDGMATEDGAQVLQLSHYSGTCPKDWYIIHITCKAGSSNNPQADIAPYVAQLFADQADRDSIVWSMYYTITSCGQCGERVSATTDECNGVHYMCGPHFELDYERSISEARELFGKLYADEEFLPRAPDPDEIIVAGSDDEESAAAVADTKVNETCTDEATNVTETKTETCPDDLNPAEPVDKI